MNTFTTDKSQSVATNHFAPISCLMLNRHDGRFRKCKSCCEASSRSCRCWVRVKRGNGNGKEEKKVKGGKAEKRVKGGKAEKRVKGGKKGKRRKKG